jgi:hypothetical protein
VKRRAAVHEHRLEWIRRQEDAESSDHDEEAPEGRGEDRSPGRKAA